MRLNCIVIGLMNIIW